MPLIRIEVYEEPYFDFVKIFLFCATFKITVKGNKSLINTSTFIIMKFLTGKELEGKIGDIIWEAERNLMIVSPYFKLDSYFKKLFDNHAKNPKLHIVILFGKNEQKVSKSLSEEDFDYFKKFLNISIIYVPNLHAKYYGNDKMGVLTSVNMYDYSFLNNIEFGVLNTTSLLQNFGKASEVDSDAWAKCWEIAEQNEVVFIKRPVYQTKKLIISLGKNYINSEVLLDQTKQFYGFAQKESLRDKRKLSDFVDEIELGSTSNKRPNREDISFELENKKCKSSESYQNQRRFEGKVAKSYPNKNDFQSGNQTKPGNYNNLTYGYCIRTGEKIPFNPSQPMSRSAWSSWNEWQNYDYPENYCHATGRFSDGLTSMRNPILS